MTYTISLLSAAILTVLVLWELVWKGIALWRTAQNDQTTWFIILLLINSAGLLPIIYLLTHHRTRATHHVAMRGTV